MSETPDHPTEPHHRLFHLGRCWDVVLFNSHWFVRDDGGCDTGPYSTWQQGADWVRDIRL